MVPLNPLFANQLLMLSASFAPHRWFEQLFGFRESVSSVRDNLRCEEINGDTYIISSANGARIRSGNFQVRSASSFDLRARGGGRLHIIHGHGRSSQRFELIDVLSSQFLPENDGATYLAASNFNCLEFVSPAQTAGDGVTNYVYDQTQGPFCALSAGAAVVDRNYFVRHSGGAGQLLREVELLGKTPIHVEHGYAIINEQFGESEVAKNFAWDDADNYCVGVHRNCQLTTTRRERGFALVDPAADRVVHHVYAAAFNFNGCVYPCDFTLRVSRHMLDAEYRASVLAAWENSLLYPGRSGSNKLYLTLLGCGVFGNEIDTVLESIESCMDTIRDSGLDVYVVCFSDSQFDHVNKALGKYVKETKGSIIYA